MADRYVKPRYRGYIPVARKGGGWYEVEIYLGRDSEAPAADLAKFETLPLEFPAQEALTVEWGEMPPETPVQGSTATLTLISPDDRFFSPLYAYKAGEVWMRVWHCHAPLLLNHPRRLYWQGSLDPELYEEPYQYRRGYEVTFVFSDFGYMDRIKYDLKGMQPIGDVMRYALQRAGFPPSSDLIVAPLSTVVAGEEGALLDTLFCNSANWYDEEGIPSTLRQVVEGILLPLGLHITQREGKIFIFDTNALWHQSETEVWWTADTQTLSAAETYNNVVITFSPYSDGRLAMTDFGYQGDTETALTILNYGYAPYCVTLDEDDEAQSEYQFTFAYDLSQYDNDTAHISDLGYASFTIFYSAQYKGLCIHSLYDSAPYDDDGLGFSGEADGTKYTGSSANTDGAWRYWPKAFRIVPYAEGEETEGIGVTMVGGAGLLENAFGYKPKLKEGKAVGGKVYRYGVQPDAPWGYKDANERTFDQWVHAVDNNGYQFDCLDYYCQYAAARPLFTSEPVYLPKIERRPVTVVTEGGTTSQLRGRTSHYIRIDLPMLLDCRYNPTTEAGEYNQEEHQKRLLASTRWLFIPFTAVLRDESGRILYTYTNRKYLYDSPEHVHLSTCEGEWIPAGYVGAMRIAQPDSVWTTDPEYNRYTKRVFSRRELYLHDGISTDAGDYLGEAWLAWYASDPLQENSTGVGGWQSNRHFIGRPDVTPAAYNALGDLIYAENPNPYISEPFKRLKSGQYLPYPPVEGYLEITLYAGMLGYGPTEKIDPHLLTGWLNEEKGSSDRGDGRRGIYNIIRWQLFKAPTIEIVKNDMSFDSCEMDDIEYSAYLDRLAHEELSLDTVFGTADNPQPTAKGLMYGPDEATLLTNLTRGTHTDTPERLLMGTLFSQYTNRRYTLSGEARLYPPQSVPMLRKWVDANASEYYEIYVADDNQPYAPAFYEYARTDDLSAGTTMLTLVQFYPDEYAPGDIVEVDEEERRNAD